MFHNDLATLGSLAPDPASRVLSPFRALAGLGMLLFVLVLAVPNGAIAVDDSARGVFVNVEGGRVWYQTCGTGSRNMVLIHDGTLHSAAWDDVWPLVC